MKPKSSERAWQEAKATKVAGADLVSAMRSERDRRAERARDAASIALIKGAVMEETKQQRSEARLEAKATIVAGADLKSFVLRVACIQQRRRGYRADGAVMEGTSRQQSEGVARSNAEA